MRTGLHIYGDADMDLSQRWLEKRLTEFTLAPIAHNLMESTKKANFLLIFSHYRKDTSKIKVTAKQKDVSITKTDDKPEAKKKAFFLDTLKEFLFLWMPKKLPYVFP